MSIYKLTEILILALTYIVSLIMIKAREPLHFSLQKKLLIKFSSNLSFMHSCKCLRNLLMPQIVVFHNFF